MSEFPLMNNQQLIILLLISVEGHFDSFFPFLQVLSHFIDCVFDGSEKDKVISLLKSVMYNVWPHLHNHRLAMN